MNYLSRAFPVSLAIHALVCTGVIGVGNFIVPAKKPLVIDFSLEKQENTAPDTARSLPARERKQAVRPAPEKAEQKRAGEPHAPVSQPLPEAQAPMAAPVPPAERAEAHAEPPISTPVAARNVSTAPEGKTIAAQGVEAKSRYMRENFSYIKDLIHKRAAYPGMARRMGWEGRVLVSFSVSYDGNVSNIKIVRSSGVEILDKSAVDAVKSASPLPKPPAEAELTVPITYKLN